jgi:hypothetical protein
VKPFSIREEHKLFTIYRESGSHLLAIFRIRKDFVMGLPGRKIMPNGFEKNPLRAKILMVTRGILAGILAAIVCLGLLMYFKINIFTGSKAAIAKALQAIEFEPRKVVTENQEYGVSVESRTETNDGNRPLMPTPDCPNIMIIDVKHIQGRNFEPLQKNLRGIEGVAKVSMDGYKIIVNRVCSSSRKLPHLWSWSELWPKIETVLKNDPQ